MVKPDLTSIIFTCFIQEPWQAHMSTAVLENITRYTNPRDYELIVMSDSEKFPIRDGYKVLKIDRYERTEGLSYAQSMNRGAKLAKGEYLCFFQNDVFVWYYWLEDLKEYVLRGLADCVMPDQIPRSFENVEKIKILDFEEAMFGLGDDGLLFITKEAFKRTGGFNESLSILQMRDFNERMDNNGVRQINTCKVLVSHIGNTTNLNRMYKQPEQYDTLMRSDVGILV